MTLSVLAVLATTAVPSMQRLLDRQRLNGRVQEMMVDLHLLRPEAHRRGANVEFSSHSDGDRSCYVIHTPGDCACHADGAACVPGVEVVKVVNLPADGGVQLTSFKSVEYKIDSRTVTPAGSFILRNRQGEQTKVFISFTGRVRSCTPGTPNCPA